MNKKEEYYFIRVEISNGNVIYKSNVKAFDNGDAWEKAYDEEDNQTLSMIDDNDTYHLFTKSHIVQVIVEKTDSPEI